VTITVICYSWAPSGGDHLFTCGAIHRPPHTSIYIINSLLAVCAVEHRIYSIKPRFIKFFFHNFMRLTIKGGLHFLFFDDQSFLGYVLSTKLFFRIRSSSASRAHPSQEGLW